MTTCEANVQTRHNHGGAFNSSENTAAQAAAVKVETGEAGST